MAHTTRKGGDGIPRTPGRFPELWELVSAELDGNGLTVDLRRKDGYTMSLGYLVTSDPAVGVFRQIAAVVADDLEERVGNNGLIITPIEPNDPEEEYREGPASGD